ncbi:DNA-binding transcriptional LysR family regulator [Pseudoduganella lurida]|uniref:DNA-binding transcriptional LysR family regulator n=1 Tax=Pseudoduganella lurida TaxID=1036180 RepID=A0A562RL22_9BURK|nr:LysR family transcriptional regulator [Pseudoduganella lurida]TWI69745.1 DNA-binding transcriptional LysR family regulator [Pseudoduganella lurida]
MQDYRPYAVLAETVLAGSMSAAARRLGMTPSAVSQTIRALERQTGVTLLHRSTRKLALTEAGARCLPHCLRLLEAANAAAASLVVARDAPAGELRIAAPVGFAGHLAQALAPVLAQWPGLNLRLLFDDALIDLIDARIDIAIRVGRLADSTWVARPLTALEIILCAAPDYLRRFGMPAAPADLAAHHWIASVRDVGDGATTLPLPLQHGSGERAHVDVPVRIASNNHLALQQMCEGGAGIARLADIDVHPALEAGRLVRLLPDWRFVPLPVALLTPRRDGEPAKVRVAAAALQDYFAGIAGRGGV